VFVANALQHLSASSKDVTSTSAAAEDKSSSKAEKRKREEVEVTGSGTAATSSGCLGYVVVSEAGASVYSASERAREEFPPEVLDISYVGAVSIGRRLVDPLSELVKVQVRFTFWTLVVTCYALCCAMTSFFTFICAQPASLGVGMYQHDLSDKGITERLRNVVEDCVNTVGIDINTASSDLLRYVSGLSDANVREIIAHRTASGAAATSSAKAKKGAAGGHAGRLECLADLKSIKGIGPKTFRNCAGFMRVYNGSESLDVTNIHPDDYDVARMMLELHRNGKVGAAGGDSEEGTSKVNKKQKTGKIETTEPATNSTSTEGSSPWSAFLQSHPVRDAGAVEDGKKKAQRSDPYALLRTKTPGELSQIWAWLQEAGLVRDSSAQASHSTTAVNGPFMSLPKVQRGIPEDFHVKIEVGSVVQGVIRNVTTFGAFVDLGGVEIGDSKGEGGTKGKGKASCDGLLHCSKYRDYVKRQPAGAKLDANAMSKEIYVGREVKVKILAIEEVEGGKEGGKSGHHEKRRIALDLMDLL
jgi:predicted RNA-binding protein with RPS1 domain/ribosomal protein L12E/L44/L45/RPP1/RPP2